MASIEDSIRKIIQEELRNFRIAFLQEFKLSQWRQQPCPQCGGKLSMAFITNKNKQGLYCVTCNKDNEELKLFYD